MCEHKSLVVTRTSILSLPNEDSHEAVIKANHLDDTTTSPDFVRVELLPTTDLMDVDTYKFKVDQDFKPDWFSAKEAEVACRLEMKKLTSLDFSAYTGHIAMPSLTSLPNGIVFPKKCGNISMNSLTTLPKGIVFPEKCEGIYMPSLTALPEGIVFPKECGYIWMAKLDKVTREKYGIM